MRSTWGHVLRHVTLLCLLLNGACARGSLCDAARFAVSDHFGTLVRNGVGPPISLTLHPTQRTIAEVPCLYGGFCDVAYSVLGNLAKI